MKRYLFVVLVILSCKNLKKESDPKTDLVDQKDLVVCSEMEYRRLEKEYLGYYNHEFYFSNDSFSILQKKDKHEFYLGFLSTNTFYKIDFDINSLKSFPKIFRDTNQKLYVLFDQTWENETLLYQVFQLSKDTIVEKGVYTFKIKAFENLKNINFFKEAKFKLNLNEKVILSLETLEEKLLFSELVYTQQPKRAELILINFADIWQGSFGFGYGFRGDDVDYEMNFEIGKEGSAFIISNDGTKEKAEIVRATKDSLELRGKENHQYILYRENGGSNYAIRGEAVYMLNPPNNDYPLTKSPLEKP